MKKYTLCLNFLFIAATMLTAYGETDAAPPQKPSITVWFNAGLGNALNAMELNIENFHNAQDSYVVEMTLVPEGVYNDRILIAGQTGDLPDLLFFDRPMVSYLAWLEYLQSIDRFVSAEMKADFLPSILAQGTYNRQLYTLGIYDSGLAMYGNRAYLEQVGVCIPTVERPWNLAEFEIALEQLTALPEVDYALDLKINYGRGEFYTFAFSPILQSFGGDLIDRNTYQSAKGVLYGPQSVAARNAFRVCFRTAGPTPNRLEMMISIVQKQRRSPGLGPGSMGCMPRPWARIWS